MSSGHSISNGHEYNKSYRKSKNTFIPKSHKKYTEGDINTTIDLTLFDIVGNKVLHQKNNSPHQQLHLQEYSKGIYYLQVRIGNKVFNEKITLQ